MRVHVEGAISDLHAADCHYHVDCMFKFMNKRSVTYADACSSCTTQDELETHSVKLLLLLVRIYLAFGTRQNYVSYTNLKGVKC